MTTFTPLSKENLIGVMLARCDGDKLGQVVVLQLSKQELILGPMQINARINQDQTISKISPSGDSRVRRYWRARP